MYQLLIKTSSTQCKTLGVSQNHSQSLVRMRRGVTRVFIACGRGRSLINYSESMHVTMLLSLEPASFSTTAAYSFVFRCMGVRSSLPLYVRSTCLCSPSPQRRPMIAVKGISRHNFRPVHFYQTPRILNLAFIVKNTYVYIVPGCSRSL